MFWDSLHCNIFNHFSSLFNVLIQYSMCHYALFLNNTLQTSTDIMADRFDLSFQSISPFVGSSTLTPTLTSTLTSILFSESTSTSTPVTVQAWWGLLDSYLESGNLMCHEKHRHIILYSSDSSNTDDTAAQQRAFTTWWEQTEIADQIQRKINRYTHRMVWANSARKTDKWSSFMKGASYEQENRHIDKDKSMIICKLCTVTFQHLSLRNQGSGMIRKHLSHPSYIKMRRGEREFNQSELFLSSFTQVSLFHVFLTVFSHGYIALTVQFSRNSNFQ